MENGFYVERHACGGRTIYYIGDDNLLTKAGVLHDFAKTRFSEKPLTRVSKNVYTAVDGHVVYIIQDHV